MPDRAFDVVIIGGGPAGATAGMVLARAGLTAVILEKARFPRFHIGESLLPRNFPLLVELGLEAAMRDVPSTPKLGAEFANGDGTNVAFGFGEGLIPGSPTLNIERGPFDLALLNGARAAGAVVHEEAAVREIITLKDGDVSVATDDGARFTGKYLFDASGQAALVGRHLGIRKNYGGKHLQKVAYFEHFEHVYRRPGPEAGHPYLVMCHEGWFWMIPIDAGRTSIGFVTDLDVTKQAGVPANRMLEWAMSRCPAVKKRTLNAAGPATNQIISNFSYHCRPFAGPGYFLLGDAATFLDPIFSSGVTLGMLSGREAAQAVQMILSGRRSAPIARHKYIRFIGHGTGIFFRLINQYYQHSFRELFLNGTGPLQIHSAVLSVLAGQVFPKMPWKLRWRMWLFALTMEINKHLPLVPRRKPFSIFAMTPEQVLETVGGVQGAAVGTVQHWATGIEAPATA